MANKTFKQHIEPVNPAMRFIDVPDVPEPAPPERPEHPTVNGKPPDGYKLNPMYLEKKSRRFQLLMQPSLYNKLKARADEGGGSINELIHSILDDAMK